MCIRVPYMIGEYLELQVWSTAGKESLTEVYSKSRC
jgi:hypothetical protein